MITAARPSSTSTADDHGYPTLAPVRSDEERDALGRKLISWWDQAKDLHAGNRIEQVLDEDYTDGIQWTEEELRDFERNSQTPLTYNEILPAVLWITGTERRTRVDSKVLPRADDDLEGAEVKTKILKYLSDVNRLPFERSAAFKDAVVVGVGWLEAGLRGDPDDEPIFVRHESWRNIWLDPFSTALDISDARYLHRSKLLDLDVALSLFQGDKRAEEALQLAATTDRRHPFDDEETSHLHRHASAIYHHQVGDFLGSEGYVTYGTYGTARKTYNRQLIRLIECWYRVPQRVKVIRGGPFGGQVFDMRSRGHRQAMETGAITSLYDATRLVVRVALLTDDGFLLRDIPSPYRHNRFPFVPLWGYRRGRDNACYGVVRNVISPQKDLNKRRMNALFRLATRRTILDEGAVEDLDELAEEVARPDGIIVKKPGKELRIESGEALAAAEVNYSNLDAEAIRQSSGVTGENLGQETNATSGKAITARQNQGTVVTATLFDNLRLGVQLTGEILLSLVEQFMSDERVVRLVGEDLRPEFLRVNQVQPDGTVLNDITARVADFVVGEQDYRESIRLSMFETLMTLTGQLPPEVSLQLLDLVMEVSDLPNKREIVQRIRALTGQVDPNDPEAKQQAEQAKQAQQQQAQQLSEMEAAKVQAEVEKLQAQAQEILAKIGKLQADTQQTRVNTQQAAVQTGGAVMINPTAAELGGDLQDLAAAG